MRIIAGTARGRTIRSLRGQALRPTTDRVRESLFGALAEKVMGASFLDLYAGSGAVGLEALSRGAEKAVFVESHPPAARLIAENAARCGLADRVRIIRGQVVRALPRLVREGAEFDLIFLDPPYGKGEVLRAMRAIGRAASLAAADGWVICQRSRREGLPDGIGGFLRKRASRFGETVIDWYQRGEPGRGAEGPAGVEHGDRLAREGDEP